MLAPTVVAQQTFSFIRVEIYNCSGRMWPLMTSLERTAVRREVAAAAAASGKLINSASARIQQLFSDVQRFVTSHLATCCRHDEKDIFISGIN